MCVARHGVCGMKEQWLTQDSPTHSDRSVLLLGIQGSPGLAESFMIMRSAVSMAYQPPTLTGQHHAL